MTVTGAAQAALGSLTSLEAERWVAAPPVVLVPLGAVEQHGPHLPLDTDTLVAVALCEAVASRSGGLGERLVAPAVNYGASGEHAGFAGTLSIGSDALASVLVELARSAENVAGLVLVSWHGGNGEATGAAVSRASAEGRRVVAWAPGVRGGDAHAGRTETSLMLAIAPDLVRLDLAEPGCTTPLDQLWPELRTGGIRPLSPNGVLGDPTGATAAEGRGLFEMLAADLEHAVDSALASWGEESR